MKLVNYIVIHYGVRNLAKIRKQSYNSPLIKFPYKNRSLIYHIIDHMRMYAMFECIDTNKDLRIYLNCPNFINYLNFLHGKNGHYNDDHGTFFVWRNIVKEETMCAFNNQ